MENTVPQNETNVTESSKTIEYSDLTLREIGLLLSKIQDDDWKSIDWLRTPRYPAAETGISSRVINYWIGTGLMPDNRDNEQGWHKFSLLDMLFITIANELRKFGFSIKQLQQTRQSLFSQLFNDDTEPKLKIMTILEFCFMRIVTLENDGNTYLLVTDDGDAIFMTYRDLIHNQERENLPNSFIYLELNKILNRVFANRKIRRWPENMQFLNNTENLVIKKIRESNTPRKFKLKTSGAGIVDHLTIKEQITLTKQLHDTINRVPNGEIKIIRRDGHTTVIETTQTIKAKNAK